MVHQYLIPGWFLGYDILLQLVFAVVALVVSIFAFKIFKLSGQRQPRLFATAFTFISVAYFIEAFLNFLILSRLNENISIALKIISVSILNTIVLYTHMILFSIGLIILTYMTFRIRSAKALFLLILITLLSLFFTENPLYLYHVLAMIFLLFVLAHYLINFLHKKQVTTLIVLIAFALLMLSSVYFIFSVIHSEVFYVVAHFLELAAYLLILINLILVQKHEQKARSSSGHS